MGWSDKDIVSLFNEDTIVTESLTYTDSVQRSICSVVAFRVYCADWMVCMEPPITSHYVFILCPHNNVAITVFVLMKMDWAVFVYLWGGWYCTYVQLIFLYCVFQMYIFIQAN